jgi:diguanylate cyclase (GGDEF)-like protein
MLHELNALLVRQSRGMVWAVCAGIMLLVFISDMLAGAQLAGSIFYLMPVAIAAWHLGWRPAVLMAVTAAAGLLAANQVAGLSYSLAVQLWNVFADGMFFVIVAAMLALLKQSLEHEREAARTDWLTGLPNTRSFLESATREIARARRNRTPLTMAYLDLDDFKDVNDAQGHAAGDRLLRQVADTLRGRLRDVDIVARLGGDEFAVLLPGTGLAEAERVVERLQPRIDEIADAGGRPVRFSIGAVSFYTPPADVAELVREADFAMYEAKRRGGGAVCRQSAA